MNGAVEMEKKRISIIKKEKNPLRRGQETRGRSQEKTKTDK